MKTFIFFISMMLAGSTLMAQQEYTISGYMTDAESGEALIGGSVYAKALSKGATSNIYGFYSLTLPAGKVKLNFSYMGYQGQEQEISLDKDMELNVKLTSSSKELKEVVIRGDANEGAAAVRSTQMNQIKVPIEQIRTLPSLGGEVDVIKAMQLLPGVKRGGEGQTGLYVRGGGPDQNLILLDEAVVYNVSHLFGFFSVFNSDAIKDVTLIKGGFPANYGGRISSVLDIRMKEGNMTHFSAEGGIGMLSSRLTLQGPILKNKISFLVSGRRSYIDKVLGLAGLQVPYYFYDLNAKVNYKISEHDRLFYSSYYGNDVLYAPKFDEGDNDGDLSLDFGFQLGNMTQTLRWNHLYNPKLFSNASLIYTRFRYDINGKFQDNSIFIGSKIRDLGAKMDFDYFLNTKNHIKYGGAITYHVFRPNIVSAQGEITEVVRSQHGKFIDNEEVALYAMNDYKVNARLNLNYGFRLSGVITDDKLYVGPEPRISSSYVLNENNSIKAGVSRAYQYVHLVSSSSVALPTDLWYPVTHNVKPQYADQVATGYTHNFPKLNSLLTVEAYYKRMHNLIEYKPGAVLILNDNYEDELLSGKGDAYGFEFFLNKTKGRFNGWIGYSLSWATRQFDGLNEGKKYFAKYDRRHDLSIVANFDISKRITFSAIWVYATGQRLTGRVGQYAMINPGYTGLDVMPIYTSKNELRFSPSHRLDVNIVIKRKPGSKWNGEWYIGAYNVYNQAQPYKVNIELDQQTGTLKYKQQGLFGFIPSISYNFKF